MSKPRTVEQKFNLDVLVCEGCHARWRIPPPTVADWPPCPRCGWDEYRLVVGGATEFTPKLPHEQIPDDPPGPMTKLG